MVGWWWWGGGGRDNDFLFGSLALSRFLTQLLIYEIETHDAPICSQKVVSCFCIKT